MILLEQPLRKDDVAIRMSVNANVVVRFPFRVLHPAILSRLLSIIVKDYVEIVYH